MSANEQGDETVSSPVEGSLKGKLEKLDIAAATSSAGGGPETHLGVPNRQFNNSSPPGLSRKSAGPTERTKVYIGKVPPARSSTMPSSGPTGTAAAPTTATILEEPPSATASASPSNTTPTRRMPLLPPLQTNHEVLANLATTSTGAAAAGTLADLGVSPGGHRIATRSHAVPIVNPLKGPQSAAPYVPPIGHSHRKMTGPASALPLEIPEEESPKQTRKEGPSVPSQEKPASSEAGSSRSVRIDTTTGMNKEERDFILSRGGSLFTAAPGKSGNDWRKQKEMLMGGAAGADNIARSAGGPRLAGSGAGKSGSGSDGLLRPPMPGNMRSTSMDNLWATAQSQQSSLPTPTSPGHTLQVFQALQQQQQQIMKQIQLNKEMIDFIAASSPGGTNGISATAGPASAIASAGTGFQGFPWGHTSSAGGGGGGNFHSPNTMTSMPYSPNQNFYGNGGGMSPHPVQQPVHPSGGGGSGSGFGKGGLSKEVLKLMEEKGYNPPNFDIKPDRARFFVIKSYTEEDVHKSLKYEIWASTDLGNKRLDRAFKEFGDKGPIYLFFSVNASGHFCGIAQMLTSLDYTSNSNVWAQDKWKGTFRVKWIYVKDVPLSALRHIKLENTAEKKPVTSSRDTQEVLYDAGLEVMKILSSYNSNTSLLQDMAFYESKELDTKAQKELQITSPISPGPNSAGSDPKQSSSPGGSHNHHGGGGGGRRGGRPRSSGGQGGGRNNRRGGSSRGKDASHGQPRPVAAAGN